MFPSTGAVILTLAFLSFLSIRIITAKPSPCSEAFYLKIQGRNLTHCKKLTTLGAEFGWSYHIDQNHTQRIEILFGASLHGDVGWLAWGVNPLRRPQMAGTRAIIGIRHPNGSLAFHTYNITSDTKLGCRLLPSKIDVQVSNLRFEYMDVGTHYTLHATLILDPLVYNISKLNHVWQIGYYAEGMEPKMHPTTLQNVDSTETIDLKSGNIESVGHHRRHLRAVHGILNIIGWGTLLPVGVIIARYFSKHPIKFHKYEKGWYYCHVTCQTVGYILGSIGWFIGLSLGKSSTYYSFATHRILAMIIFSFTTLQIFALRFKPKRDDDYRKYWDLYHHFLGYALIALIIVNIFQGIAILTPDNTWKWVYIGVLGVLASISVSLEIYSWTKFNTDRKKGEPVQPPTPN